MMDLNVLENFIVMLGDLRFSSSRREGPSEMPRFFGLTVALLIHCNQLPPVVPSLKYVQEEEGNGCYENISLPDQFLCSSKLLQHFNVMRMAIQVIQYGDLVFGDLLNKLATGRVPTDAHLPLKLT